MGEATVRNKRESDVVKTAAALLVLLFASHVTLAQADSAFAFFPLNTGDLRQFHFHYSYWNCSVIPPVLVTHSTYHVQTVLADTLLPTGFVYKIIASDVPSDPWPQYLRVDTSSANVYRFVPDPAPHEVLMDSLCASPGSTFVRDGWMMTECTGIDTATILGVQTIVKSFNSSYVYGAQYSLAYGFGLIQHVTYEDDPCYAMLDPQYLDLVFARINGQEHGTFVGVEERQELSPRKFVFAQNYPNPFNPSTTICVSVPQATTVEVTIFDPLGRHIATLFSGELPAGEHRLTWDATGFASGIYFYRLRTPGIVQTKRMLVVR